MSAIFSIKWSSLSNCITSPLKTTALHFCALLAFGILVFSCGNSTSEPQNEGRPKINPFASHFGETPSKEDYVGPIYKGNFAYPGDKPVGKIYPWNIIADGKQLTLENAKAYMDALHVHIKEDMSIMVNEPAKWIKSENKKRWFNMAWAGQKFKKTGWDGAEPLSGTLTGQILNKGVFSAYGYDGPMQNHVTVYYNETAAYTLHKLWKDKDPNGFYPNYTTEAAQFEQNSIIIKAAATDCTPEKWKILKGTGKLPIYRPIVYGPNKTEKNVVQYLNWIQFDIIVKDTIAAPETGWVFATYIYDANSKGTTTFDKMTLQGAMWGMDPDKMDGKSPLKETYLNPEAPAYGFANIGFGHRLSGPIDVAKVGGEKADGTKKTVFVLNKDDQPEGGVVNETYRASSCLSCHGTASYPYHNDFYPSPKFRLVYTDTIFHPESHGWHLYNTNRPGNVIMPSASGKNISWMALDYDLFVLFALTNSGQLHHLPARDKPLPPKNYNPAWLQKKSHPLF